MHLEIIAFGKNGEIFPRMRYLWYSKKEAVRLYRERHGLRYKHVEIVVRRVTN